MLKVNVRIAGSFADERFLARMTRDCRLTIPKLTLKLLQEARASACFFSIFSSVPGVLGLERISLESGVKWIPSAR